MTRFASTGLEHAKVEERISVEFGVAEKREGEGEEVGELRLWQQHLSSSERERSPNFFTASQL